MQWSAAVAVVVVVVVVAGEPSFRSSNAKVIKYTFKNFSFRGTVARICVRVCRVCVCASASECLPQRGQSVHAHVNAKNNRPPVCMLMSPPTKWSVCLPAILSVSLSLCASSCPLQQQLPSAVCPRHVWACNYASCRRRRRVQHVLRCVRGAAATGINGIYSTMAVHAYLFKYSNLLHSTLNTQLEQLKKAELLS